MEWVSWLIPLIALVVWIVVNLIKVPQDQNAAQRPQPPRASPSGQPRPAPRTDLDRFIEEAKRRKRQQEEARARRRPPPPPLPKHRPEAAETEGALPRVRPVTESSARTKPVPPPPPGTRPERTPVDRTEQEYRAPALEQAAEPANFDVRMTQAAEESQQQERSAGFATPHASRTTQAASAFSIEVTGQPGVSGHILDMFRDANSARYAFMLREILDRPVSARRRRR